MGDCWFLAAVVALSEKTNLFEVGVEVEVSILIIKIHFKTRSERFITFAFIKSHELNSSPVDLPQLASTLR